MTESSTVQTSSATISRPVLRYHGGKWRLAPWVIEHLPPHRIYVEPYGGAASVLMLKARSYAEIYNDLDGEIVNVFKVLRDPQSASELLRQLLITPFAREEFLSAYDMADDAIEQARRTIIKSFMGFGSSAIHRKDGMRTRASTWKPPVGFRSNSNRSGTTPAHDWSNYPEQLSRFCERLRGVVIENRKGIEVIKAHDRADTLHYIDPPYVGSTRDRGSDYTHEMRDEDHRELASVLHKAKGMVVLSGYRSDLYKELYGNWSRVECAAFADGARPRTEVLWLNPSAQKALNEMKRQQSLFLEAI